MTSFLGRRLSRKEDLIADLWKRFGQRDLNTRARLRQIMNLLLLAPDIQEQILELASVTARRDPMTERQLRCVA
jgi:hypothetical protein